MKLNFCYDNQAMHNFTNIGKEPIAVSADGYDYRQGQVLCLDWIADDNSVELINAGYSLHSIPIQDLPDAIRNWSNKLISNGGALIANIYDIDVAAMHYANGQITLHEINSILGYGRAYKAAIGRSELEKCLVQAGLVIESKSYDGITFTVMAIRGCRC